MAQAQLYYKISTTKKMFEIRANSRCFFFIYFCACILAVTYCNKFWAGAVRACIYFRIHSTLFVLFYSRLRNITKRYKISNQILCSFDPVSILSLIFLNDASNKCAHFLFLYTYKSSVNNSKITKSYIVSHLTATQKTWSRPKVLEILNRC